MYIRNKNKSVFLKLGNLILNLRSKILNFFHDLGPQNNFSTRLLTGIILISNCLPSCKKFVEVPAPSTSTNAPLVFSNDASAIASLTAIYTRMSQNGINNGITSISVLAGLSADELMLFNGTTSTSLLAYYKNALTSNLASTNNAWSDSYYIIFMANAAIEGLNLSSKITASIKQKLLGEAKFMRAFCYFYLVNLYGDVPLVLTSDYKANSIIGRTSKQLVYEQIITDLKDAQNNLSDNYLDVTLLAFSEERIVPNKWAASAMLARTYLYIGDNIGAEAQTTAVINHTSLYDLADVNSVFLKNSQEAIWQIQSVSNVFTNTTDARLYILPTNGPNTTNFSIYLFKDLDTVFDLNDQRKSSWLGSVTVDRNTYYYPYKYKSNDLFAPVTEYSMVLRLAEQYLIRAEALAQQNRLSEAKEDLDKIRLRAGLGPITVTSQSAMLDAILLERKKELFTEWGHRWLDLKRTGEVDEVMPGVSIEKGGTWESYKQLYPIPQTDIERNPTLANQQNPGYN